MATAVSLLPRSSPQSLAKNTFINFAGQVAVAGIAVLFLPLIVRHLGAARYGLLSLALVAFGSFTFLDLGLSRTTTRFVAAAAGDERKEHVAKVIWTAVFVQAVSGVIGGLVLILTRGWITQSLHLAPGMAAQARSMFVILGIAVPVVLTSASFRGALEGAQRFGIVNSVKVALNASTYAIPLAGALLGSSIPNMVMAMLFARSFAMVCYAVGCARCIPGFSRISVLSRSESIELFSFSGWVALSNFAVPLLVQIDRFLIASLITVAAVTYYAVPFELLNGIWLIPASFSAVLLPAFSGITEDQIRSNELFARSLKYVLLTTGAAVAVTTVFAHTLLLLWQGAVIAEQSTEVLQILLVGLLVNSLAWVPGSLLLAAKRPDVPAKIHLIQLVPYFAAAYLLIKHLGVKGAAIAFLLRVSLESGLLFYWNSRVSRLDAWWEGPGIRRTLLVLVALAVGLSFSVHADGVLTTIMVSIASVTAFIVCSWFFVLDRKERQVFSTSIMRDVRLAASGLDR